MRIMKRVVLPVAAMLLVLAIAGIAGCSSSPSTSTPAGKASTPASQTSMKGFELYSWIDGGVAHYALLPGTDRLKTREEITAAGVVGLGKLDALLNKLAKGQEVVWTTHGITGMVMPPPDIVAQVKSYCTSKGLKLTVAP
jgi:hypothetical protein